MNGMEEERKEAREGGRDGGRLGTLFLCFTHYIQTLPNIVIGKRNSTFIKIIKYFLIIKYVFITDNYITSYQKN